MYQRGRDDGVRTCQHALDVHFSKRLELVRPVHLGLRVHHCRTQCLSLCAGHVHFLELLASATIPITLFLHRG
jgi:hypothetical protein